MVIHPMIDMSAIFVRCGGGRKKSAVGHGCKKCSRDWCRVLQAGFPEMGRLLADQVLLYRLSLFEYMPLHAATSLH